VPFFDGRIVFPYWSRGQVVFMIGRRTPWTPDVDWEKSKYKKLAVRNGRNNDHVAPCIRNDVLFNEDVFLTRPDRVIITEGVTDCISLMEHRFPVVSPVTVQIRDADWERLLPKLRGVKTVYVCQDNEISEAGMQGGLKTARILAGHGIITRVAALPLGEKQRAAREKLAGLAAGSAETDALEADAKIDVNEFFAAGHTAADFEAILASAQTPLEMAISKLSTDIPDADLSRLLEPILAEVGRLDPIEQERHLRLIQTRCGKVRMPVTTLRKQLKVVEIARPRRPTQAGAFGGGMRGAAATAPAGEPELSHCEASRSTIGSCATLLTMPGPRSMRSTRQPRRAVLISHFSSRMAALSYASQATAPMHTSKPSARRSCTACWPEVPTGTR
jgi:DNA primase